MIKAYLMIMLLDKNGHLGTMIKGNLSHSSGLSLRNGT